MAYGYLGVPFLLPLVSDDTQVAQDDVIKKDEKPDPKAAKEKLVANGWFNAKLTGRDKEECRRILRRKKADRRDGGGLHPGRPCWVTKHPTG